MSAPPRLELIIPPTCLALQGTEGNTPSEGQSRTDSPSSEPTLVPSNCTSPSSVDTVLTKFPEPKEVVKLPAGPTLSTSHLLVIHIGAALTLFLATTDATIVSTSLPTISSELTASTSEYTWVCVAYLLTQTAFQPLYGRLSDLIGRKPLLYSSIAIFASGSALCGCAQSIKWLISARALAGIGGGGIVSAVWVTTSELVEPRQRAVWSQALSVTWSCSAVGGPLIGGVFSGRHGGWRWGFYINLPICCVSFLILFLSLRGVEMKPSSNAPWRLLKQKFDFIGLSLFMGGTSCIIVGFSFASEVGWSKPATLVPIITGILVFICGGFYENYTSRDCLFPPTTFQDVTTAAILLISFLHNFAFNAGTFYLALFYQTATGSTPTQSGLKILPYSLGASLASMPVAWLIGYWQSRTHDTRGQNWMISIGLFISTLGFGLLTLMDENSPTIKQIFFPLISGIGIGMLFHAPYQVFLNALRPHELATGTSAFFLVRFTGATIGLAVAGTVFDACADLPHLKFHGSSPAIDFSKIKQLTEEKQQQTIHSIAGSIRMIWAVCGPCLAVSFLVSFLLRTMPCFDSTETVKSPTATSSLTEDQKV